MRQLSEFELDAVAGGVKPPPPPPPPMDLGKFFDLLGELFTHGVQIVASAINFTWTLNLGSVNIPTGTQATGAPIQVDFSQSFDSGVMGGHVTTTGTLTIEPITGTYTVDAQFDIPMLPPGSGPTVGGVSGTFQIEGQK